MLRWFKNFFFPPMISLDLKEMEKTKLREYNMIVIRNILELSRQGILRWQKAKGNDNYLSDVITFNGTRIQITIGHYGCFISDGSHDVNSGKDHYVNVAPMFDNELHEIREELLRFIVLLEMETIRTDLENLWVNPLLEQSLLESPLSM